MRSYFDTKVAPAVCAACLLTAGMAVPASGQDWSSWYRPVDQPVFSTQNGNNHDAILFYEPESVYKYKLIIGHDRTGADFWRATSWSLDSADWELVNDDYDISGEYEYDDGVKVNGKYYLYENQKVYTTTTGLDVADGNWLQEGTFPSATDDVGVYYEDGWFHLFGEYTGVHGDYPFGFDGTTIAHYKSQTGLGDWQLVSETAADPNPGGNVVYGVGDASVVKIGDEYWMFLDRESESENQTYRVTAWKTDSLDTLNSPFQFVDIAMAPREGKTDDWDNHRIQDAEVQFVPELNRFVAFVNMMDIDGDPGPGGVDFNHGSLPPDGTRVVGIFYSSDIIPEPSAAALLALGSMLLLRRRRTAGDARGR